MRQCVLCEIAAATNVHEEPDLVAFLDFAPIRRGHVQIVPRPHVETFEQLAPGGDVAHADAHVIPIVENTDVTSGRYGVGDIQLASSHLRVDAATLAAVKPELAP